MPHPDVLIDRETEQARLRELLAAGEQKLVLVYGRRRVGKTYLLGRTWGDDASSFYFTAAETTPTQNREALLSALAEWSGETIHPEDYPTWRSVFRLLLEFRSPEPLVVTLDEFQYLGENPRELNAVASELNAVWEMRRPRRPLVLVLAGSAVRTLEALNEGGSPLYGRFAWQCQLRPFNYWHAGELAGYADPRDRAYVYGIFGGTPRYLSPVDPGRTVGENAVSLMLNPTGEVRELVQTALLQEQGLREIPKYVAILRAVGEGRTQLNEIAQGSGLELDTALRDKLERLMGLDYVRAGRNLGAKSREPFRYRVSDPAFRFYYRFVAPLESALATQDPGAVWEQHIAPNLDSYMGLIFEGIVEEAYYRLQGRLRLPLVAEWGRWEGLDRDRKQLEMDVASMLMDGRVLTGSIKWHRDPVDVAVHTQHLAMLDRLAQSGVSWAHTAREPRSPLLYVSSAGFTDRFVEAARESREEVYLWSLKDVFQP
ncbi:ATP-binding protein [Longimicrobium sp.]|uniref:ATP-binding protein n=1 Tax=Longimicrobium sp. TaxID=2029185 RepID=UPI002E2EF9C8|nr:ATP-binding protein [Longimicrobium sp.]HEX6041556.1 ATP-binding protein [Longimicrobium sp.]